MSFPKDFIWGAATSAYQIEGAAGEDGRGPSVWDAFCRRPGAILDGSSGATACDHYHRYAEDVGLMQQLGLQAYRFSLSWPRVMPGGRGAVNGRGLDFYDRLVDCLLAAGITPFVTLYHWDLPLALHELGGWLHPDSPQWFARFAEAAVTRLSDRVRHWITFNEPQIFVGMGYQDGTHAPGERLDFSKVLAVAHNVLLAHGAAAQVIRSRAHRPPAIGYCLAPSPVPVPATESPQDIGAARAVFGGITEKTCLNTTWWTDPVVLGRYPDDGLALFGPDLPAIAAQDLGIIAEPIDFLGLNVYFGFPYRAGAGGAPELVPFAPNQELSGFGWPVVPPSLYWAARFFAERYDLPVIVTENGMACDDEPGPGGAVHDGQRTAFFARYLRELGRACAEGIDVRGYFAWSLLDNFEWAAGYTQRFGLARVDFATQKRTVKDSGLWYRRVIEAGGSNL
jgi:beta-glucosidase